MLLLLVLHWVEESVLCKMHAAGGISGAAAVAVALI